MRISRNGWLSSFRSSKVPLNFRIFGPFDGFLVTEVDIIHGFVSVN